MAQGQFTLERIQNDPTFDYLTTPNYINILQKLLDSEKNIYSLRRQRYALDKITEDSHAMFNNLVEEYSDMYSSYVSAKKQTMNDIKQGYSEPQTAAYSNSTDAMNEILRRQDAAAKYALMSDDDLSQLVDDSANTLFNLPIFDQQVILNELKKRNIDYSLAELQTSREEQYKTDPNWQRTSKELLGIETCPPQGINTSLVVLVSQGDQTYNMEYIELKDMLEFGTVAMNESMAEEKLAHLQIEIDSLKGIGKQNNNDRLSAMARQTIDAYNSRDELAESYKVADNDPRINENGSKYSWVVFYTFLVERFGDDPRIKANPVYYDPGDPSYDIDKRYKLLKQIYKEQKSLGEYRPVKVIDVQNENPEEMSDKDIAKVFGDIK